MLVQILSMSRFAARYFMYFRALPFDFINIMKNFTKLNAEYPSITEIFFVF